MPVPDEPAANAIGEQTMFRKIIPLILSIIATGTLFIFGGRFISNCIIGADNEQFTATYSNGMHLYVFLAWAPLCMFFGYLFGAAVRAKSFAPFKIGSWRRDVTASFWLMVLCMAVNMTVYKVYAQHLGAGDDADLWTLVTILACVWNFRRIMK